MKIVKLKAENIKKLIAVEITPNGNLVKITGKNAAGKTSVLDSIFWALGGSENIQEQPVRQGETKAKVELDMGEIIVRRSFNSLENGTTTALTIENKDGLRFKSPQTMLDGLLGKLAFDPLEFMRQDPRRQFETLRALTGVDFSKLDGIRQKTYDERTLVNREAVRLKVSHGSVAMPSGYGLVTDAPKEEIDTDGIVRRINEAIEAHNAQGKLAKDAEFAGTILFKVQSGVKELKEQIELYENDLARFKMQLKKAEEDSRLAEDESMRLNKLVVEAVVPDIEPLRQQLSEAQHQNKCFQAAESFRKQKETLQKSITEAEKQSGSLTTQIEEIDKQKADMIAAAKFPLEGLGFGNGVVIYNGLPLSQAASSEQLRVSMAMAMALNPTLRVIRITDGSLLDSSSMKIVEEMANGQDYQVWIEQVDETGKVGIVIEDGMVKAVN